MSEIDEWMNSGATPSTTLGSSSTDNGDQTKNAASKSAILAEGSSDGSIVKASYWANKYNEVQKHAHEHNRDPDWFKHEKHIIIFSWAGRPIFTRYGDETKLAAFVGVISAFVSNFQRMGDSVKAVFAGDYKIVFLFRGPIHLVAISRTRESVQQLQQQLHYAHDQIISVLGGGVHALLEARPNSDIRSSMSGTELLLNDIMNEADRNPAHLFEVIQVLRLNQAARSKVLNVLKKGSTKSKSLLYTLLIAGGKLVSMNKPKERVLHPADLHILTNFVTNSQSLRSSESWTPICLPRFSDKGFLYAYVHFVAEDICLVFVTGDPQDFYELREARQEVSSALQSKGTLEDVSSALAEQDWTVDSTDCGCPELRHFMYRTDVFGQFVITAPAEPFIDHDAPDKGQRELFRLYQHVASRINSGPQVGKGGIDKRHLLYFESSNEACVLGYVRPGEFELYATFLPMTPKETAMAGVMRVLRWIKREEANLFIM